jgi:subtilase family serine protease
MFLLPKKGKSSALNRLPSKATPAATVAGMLGQADLQAAYGLTSLSSSGGTGVTVAIVDAFHDPTVQGDLAHYRAEFGLPACSGSGAGCLTEYNQNGSTSSSSLPTGTNIGWEDETALDVEMVSAICPNCSIALVESDNDSLPSLGTAVNTAARLWKFVSASWGGTDFPGEQAFDAKFFNHPGVALSFASGDAGYGPEYPASSGLVTSVGGTYLTGDTSTRGYSEVAWSGQGTGAGTGTASGCATGEGKPSWQTDGGCANRTLNDVSAVASALDGVDLFTSSGSCPDATGTTAADCPAFGTSVAAPIITAVYALAGTPHAGTYPAQYLYQANHATSLFDVTSGADGACESTRTYLCTARGGFDGPTGWGTPNGVAAFQYNATGNTVSVINPGYYALQAGVRYTLPAIKAIDSASGQTLTYTVSGLPSGFSINHSTGVISGTLSATPANTVLRVTARDTTGAAATVAFRISSVKSLIASYHPGTGFIQSYLNNGHLCVNDTRNSTANGTPVDIYQCLNVASENGWSYTPSGAPGVPYLVKIHGICAYASGNPISSGSRAGLFQCNGAPSEKWALGGINGQIIGGQLIQASSGLCLTDPGSSTRNNTQLTVTPCNGDLSQAFLLPASPITSGVAGKCIQYGGSGAISTACSTSSLQKAQILADGEIRMNGKCLYKAGTSFNNGTAVGFLPCGTGVSKIWGITAYGQLENLVSEKCLAIPNNSATNGTKLVVTDCAGQPGEVWAVS